MSIPAPARLLYTIEQTVSATGIGRTKLYELIGTGTLPVIRIDGRPRIAASDLQKLIDEHRIDGKAA